WRLPLPDFRRNSRCASTCAPRGCATGKSPKSSASRSQPCRSSCDAPWSACRRRRDEMSTTMDTLDAHLTDEQLVAALDGELIPADLARVDEHLAACWTCRARRDELAATMTDFVQTRDTVFSRIPGPPIWPSLEPLFAELNASEKSARSFWALMTD